MGSRTGYDDGREVDEAPRPKSLFRDYAETILVCVVFLVFTRAFIFQQSKIPSGSMEDTLLIGDYIMVNRFVYSPAPTRLERAVLPVRDVERGDVVVFKFPEKPEVDYIKRVIGVPGDVVEVTDGRVRRNGEWLEEPFVAARYREADHRDWGPREVPPGKYFVLGDHRNESEDSRRWGWVDRGLMKGRALLIWYSFDEDGGSHLQSAGQQARNWLYKVRYFFQKSRFSRCFTLIR